MQRPLAFLANRVAAWFVAALLGIAAIISLLFFFYAHGNGPMTGDCDIYDKEPTGQVTSMRVGDGRVTDGDLGTCKLVEKMYYVAALLRNGAESSRPDPVRICLKLSDTASTEKDATTLMNKFIAKLSHERGLRTEVKERLQSEAQTITRIVYSREDGGMPAIYVGQLGFNYCLDGTHLDLRQERSSSLLW